MAQTDLKNYTVPWSKGEGPIVWFFWRYPRAYIFYYNPDKSGQYLFYIPNLKQRSESLRLIKSAMFGATFNVVACVGLPTTILEDVSVTDTIDWYLPSSSVPKIMAVRNQVKSCSKTGRPGQS